MQTSAKTHSSPEATPANVSWMIVETVWYKHTQSTRPNTTPHRNLCLTAPLGSLRQKPRRHRQATWHSCRDIINVSRYLR